MRLLPLLVLLPLCAAPAFAQSPAPPQVVAPTPAHTRLTWEQRFAQANISHDGHLTLEQAKGGYLSIARHFAEIDAEHKGFVTLDDIRAWHKQQREARRHNAADHGEVLRPQPAFHHSMLRTPAVGTDAHSVLPMAPAGDPPAPPKGIDSNAPS
jgi:hypothetical protein